ncbi:hypothetical protein [Tardiphaga sp. P9-11]|jgi:hypothetical protein|uniref:hypothetical protein n=1 Tax=Tardiphaga sp. P9-11 TaxID=2024614 RepID=UPI0011F2044A|nr:hypothetical protein [Tardiphaga sp. P9-11]KAA0076948.1 hypothetical protein CIW50_12425 [Tardiphaga sp. P9-11]
MARVFPITALTAALLVSAVAGSAARAEDEPVKVDAVKAAEFNKRMFAGSLGPKLSYACFVRRYDAEHLARHPKQKVSTMKLLVVAGHPPEESYTPYSFRLGFKYRHRKGDWDSSGSCGQIQDTDKGQEVKFACSVDCDGGGIGIGLAKENDATLVRVERVRIWQNSKPDEEPGTDALTGGEDDKIFRLDRTDLKECESLITDRKELAAMRSK